MSTNPEIPPPLSNSSTRALSGPVSANRSLAAIVFTDTVNFSSMMSRDEDRALRLVARDLSFMKTICASYGGEVAKATGDGLLLVFSSAVQAVGCAMEIQRDFREQHKSQPSSERLYHRIGIHLGDVFQQDGDVMGDGVNIAARLQAESEKGGVCLSGTVYDIVHNRVPFVVTRSGPRRLKNVGTIVTYQAFPPRDGSPYLQIAWSQIQAKRRWIIIGAVLLGVYLLNRPTHHTHSRVAAAPSAAREVGPLGPPLASSPDEDSDEKPPSSPPAGSHSASLTDFYVARYEYMQHYDFAGMLEWLKDNQAPEVPQQPMAEACTLMEQLDEWCTRQLGAYTAASPLNVHGGHMETEEAQDVPTNLGTQDFQVWGGSNGGIIYKTGAHIAPLTKDQIPPLIWARIAATLLRQNAQPGEPATQQLERGLASFREAYHVTN